MLRRFGAGRPFRRTAWHNREQRPAGPHADAAFCEECRRWTHSDDMVDRPGFHPAQMPWNAIRHRVNGPSATVCRACAQRIEATMIECPACGRRDTGDPQYENGEWRSCDRCGRRACFSCLPIDPAPMSGAWLSEPYEWVCSECWTEVVARHERRRADGAEH